jgi:hypothetical protein
VCGGRGRGAEGGAEGEGKVFALVGGVCERSEGVGKRGV